MRRLISQNKFIVVIIGIMLCLGVVAWASGELVSSPTNDGKVTVTTAAELKAAVASADVSHVIIAGNISMDNYITTLGAFKCGLAISRDTPLILELSNDSVLSVSSAAVDTVTSSSSCTVTVSSFVCIVAIISPSLS